MCLSHLTWIRKIQSAAFMESTQNIGAQLTGFEPVRAEPNGFLVHRLNHSATTASQGACQCSLLWCYGHSLSLGVWLFNVVHVVGFNKEINF